MEKCGEDAGEREQRSFSVFPDGDQAGHGVLIADCVFGSAGPHILLAEWTWVGGGLCLCNRLPERRTCEKARWEYPHGALQHLDLGFARRLSEKHCLTAAGGKDCVSSLCVCVCH